MQVIRKRFQDVLLSIDPKNTSDPKVLRDTQKADGSWDDINYTDRARGAWEAYQHLSRAFMMAQSFRNKNSRFYLDPGMSAAVRAAVRWWVASDLRNPNWWWNEIAVPRTIGNILLLMDDAVPAKEREAAMPFLKRCKQKRTGQNFLWYLVQKVICASLEESDSDMEDASRQIAGLLAVQSPGADGIQADASFHQHDRVLYSGGYGRAFVSDCGLLICVLSGTRFALPGDRMKTFAFLLLDGIQWMNRGPTLDYGIIGRAISRRQPQSASERLGASGTLPGLSIPDVFRLMCDIPTGREDEFHRANDRYRKILRGDADPGIGGIKYFRQSDFLVQNGKDFYISVRMHSNRLYNTDFPCNGEGLKSHYIADGCTFIMRSGLEYYHIFPCWDWKRIPGTTELQTSEPLSVDNVRRKGTNAFVGGMGGKCTGMACMDFSRGSLKAHKAWFLSPREFFALGAGISCDQHGEIETTVNQSLLNGAVRIRDKNGIRTLKSNSRRILKTPCEVEHDGIVYSFPRQTASVYVTTASRTGDWFDINKGTFKSPTLHSCNVFMLGLLHGNAPVSGVSDNYIYRIIPGVTLESMKTVTPGIEAVCNTNACQAAVQLNDTKGNSVCQAIFYEPGALSPWPGLRFEVDKPCLIRLLEKGKRTEGCRKVEIELVNPVHGTPDANVNVSFEERKEKDGTTSKH